MQNKNIRKLKRVSKIFSAPSERLYAAIESMDMQNLAEVRSVLAKHGHEIDLEKKCVNEFGNGFTLLETAISRYISDDLHNRCYGKEYNFHHDTETGLQIITELVNAGAKVDMALIAAVQAHNLALVKCFVTVPGVDLNARGADGMTALMWTADSDLLEHLSIPIAQALLAAGADPCAKVHGATEDPVTYVPLPHHAHQGHLTASSIEGWTVLDFAQKRHCRRIEKIIQDALNGLPPSPVSLRPNPLPGHGP